VEAELPHEETFLLIAGSIGVAFALLLSYWTARSISSPIQQAATSWCSRRIKRAWQWSNWRARVKALQKRYRGRRRRSNKPARRWRN
jgi:hypothetical protein